MSLRGALSPLLAFSCSAVHAIGGAPEKTWFDIKLRSELRAVSVVPFDPVELFPPAGVLLGGVAPPENDGRPSRFLSFLDCFSALWAHVVL